MGLPSLSSNVAADRISVAQGTYFLLTGLWPLVDIGSFQKVTGPKRDLWLVRTVGVLIALIGAVLTWAGLRRRADSDIALLAGGSAAGLAAVDVVYAARGVISPVYLADALVELGFAGLWAGRLARPRGRRA